MPREQPLSASAVQLRACLVGVTLNHLVGEGDRSPIVAKRVSAILYGRDHPRRWGALRRSATRSTARKPGAGHLSGSKRGGSNNSALGSNCALPKSLIPATAAAAAHAAPRAPLALGDLPGDSVVSGFLACRDSGRRGAVVAPVQSLGLAKMTLVKIGNTCVTGISKRGVVSIATCGLAREAGRELPDVPPDWNEPVPSFRTNGWKLSRNSATSRGGNIPEVGGAKCMVGWRGSRKFNFRCWLRSG